jgi:hypothetical protein
LEVAGALRQLCDGVHVVERPQRFWGIELGARMTVLELEGGLLVHSPVDLDPSAVAHLGPLRWALAPNLFHHLYVGRWVSAGAEAWAAAGLPEKRLDVPFTGVVARGSAPFGGDVVLFPLTSLPFVNEVVALHRPSRTLLVVDLVFNVNPTAPPLTRAAMRCAFGYPGPSATLLERALMRRDTARREIAELLDQDFDRLIVAHGDVIETGGKAALAHAYGWLS